MSSCISYFITIYNIFYSHVFNCNIWSRPISFCFIFLPSYSLPIFIHLLGLPLSHNTSSAKRVEIRTCFLCSTTAFSAHYWTAQHACRRTLTTSCVTLANRIMSVDEGDREGHGCSTLELHFRTVIILYCIFLSCPGEEGAGGLWDRVLSTEGIWRGHGGQKRQW